MRLTIDTETDSLATVVATLTAAYGEEVSLGASSSGPKRKAAAQPRDTKRKSSTSERPATTKRSTASKPKAMPSAAEVRVWAKRRGIAVAQQGRIPAQVMEQYLAGKK